ncbi:hypothetical protein N7471_001990 [Penicillium samsonianum]|uniref:uncharacterized protein n=1 Tax=Penicillium samsonianum TaxID=1882272 RepID=UPI0025478939|nr:uncharacterized protein N7471_001990 [Penicillium samsonianum]KAJ6142537.1 hypothetical protein N7471_001990 [Penicillium samsonianum]
MICRTRNCESPRRLSGRPGKIRIQGEMSLLIPRGVRGPGWEPSPKKKEFGTVERRSGVRTSTTYWDGFLTRQIQQAGYSDMG